MSSRAKSRDLGGRCGEILPTWIEALDQRDLFRTSPRLDLLLASDGVLDPRVFLAVNEPIDSVSRRERIRIHTVAMLSKPAVQPSGHTDVQHAIDTGEDVDVVDPHRRRGYLGAPPTRPDPSTSLGMTAGLGMTVGLGMTGAIVLQH